MQLRTLLCLFFGLACCAELALAMPKAAENEAAQVGQGSDVARPKKSAAPAKAKAGASASAKGKRAGAASPPRAAKARHGSVRMSASALC